MAIMGVSYEPARKVVIFVVPEAFKTATPLLIICDHNAR
jgi:hypothetical protein